eukprot:2914077-Pyramimonas_sp.AAC.1
MVSALTWGRHMSSNARAREVRARSRGACDYTARVSNTTMLDWKRRLRPTVTQHSGGAFVVVRQGAQRSRAQTHCPLLNALGTRSPASLGRIVKRFGYSLQSYSGLDDQ